MNTLARNTIVLIGVATLLGCRGNDDGSPLQGVNEATNTEGTCPFPGKLPFTTESTKFSSKDTTELLKDYKIPVYEAEDILGLPENEANELTGSVKLAATSMLLPQPVIGEYVSLWATDTDGAWTKLGRTKTDDEGAFGITLPNTADFGVGSFPVFTVVEGNTSCMVHGIFHWPQETQVIITDIDGTLTLDDNQFLKQVSQDPNYDPLLNESGDKVMQAWAEKGYKIVYLTSRPYTLRGPTREWLHAKKIPFGPLITADSFVFGPSAREYKRNAVNQMKNEFKWKVVAAYGNADSDYQAYEDAGIPKQITFIVGPRAGESGTVPIGNNDYTDHLNSYVEKQPSADQPF